MTPTTPREAAELAYQTVLVTAGSPELADLMQKAVLDAYRTGWNRGLGWTARMPWWLRNRRRILAARKESL